MVNFSNWTIVDESGKYDVTAFGSLPHGWSCETCSNRADYSIAHRTDDTAAIVGICQSCAEYAVNADDSGDEWVAPFDGMGVLVEDLVVQPINCDCEDDHSCEVCETGLRLNIAVAAVGTSDDDDPRIFMVCADHTLGELASFLS